MRYVLIFLFFFQAEDGIRDLVRSRGLGDVYKRQTRNCLCGLVNHIEEGSVSTEVLLDLGKGVTLAAIITNESHKMLGFAVGSRACALIKESHIILGVD